MRQAKQDRTAAEASGSPGSQVVRHGFLWRSTVPCRLPVRYGEPLAFTRACRRDTAARMTVELVEIEVVCSDKGQHRRRVESRTTDISGLALPTWQQVLDRQYEPWKTAHVINTAGRTLEESLSQAETIVLGSRERSESSFAVCIRSEKTFAVEVDEVLGRIGNPHLRLPGDLRQVLAHRRAVEERRHEDQPGC